MRILAAINFSMKTTISLFLILLVIVAEAQQSYVIIDSISSPEESKQPTWIALEKKHKHRIDHIPTGEAIVALPPGDYSIRHIDFSRHESSGNGSIYLKKDDYFSFEIKENEVTLVGTIVVELDKRKKNNQYIRLERTEALLMAACQRNKNVLDKTPVRIVYFDGSHKLVKLECESKPA